MSDPPNPPEQSLPAGPDDAPLLLAGITVGPGADDSRPLFPSVPSDPFGGADPEPLSRGKDELNMAEYPLSLAGKTLGKRRASVATFRDVIRDKQTGRPVERSVTISGASDLGLPTYYDEEVLFGILQLTHHARAADGSWPREVTFSRHRLAKLLGLKHGGSAYKRLKDSIDRLVSTTYRFTYAFFDKEQEAWKPGLTINFIQSAEYHGGRAGGGAAGRGTFGDVTVRWHDAIFRNFEAGYLRDIDFLEYRAMGLPLAKALYRYLGKHFYRQARLDLDLKVLAHEKLGLSRGYDSSQVKRALAPAIRRLEERGYVVTEPPERRYAKIAAGVWRVRFERVSSQRRPTPSLPGPTPLELELIDAGVSRTVAAELVADHPAGQISANLDVLRWLTDAGRPPQSPGGWLAQCVRQDWQNPPGYEPPAARETRKRTADAKRSRRASADDEAKRVEAERDRVLLVREEVARARLAELSPAELEALTREALGESPTAFQRRRSERFVLAKLAARLEAAGEVPPLPAAGDAPEAP